MPPLFKLILISISFLFAQVSWAVDPLDSKTDILTRTTLAAAAQFIANSLTAAWNNNNIQEENQNEDSTSDGTHQTNRESTLLTPFIEENNETTAVDNETPSSEEAIEINIIENNSDTQPNIAPTKKKKKRKKSSAKRKAEKKKKADLEKQAASITEINTRFFNGLPIQQAFRREIVAENNPLILHLIFSGRKSNLNVDEFGIVMEELRSKYRNFLKTMNPIQRTHILAFVFSELIDFLKKQLDDDSESLNELLDFILRELQLANFPKKDLKLILIDYTRGAKILKELEDRLIEFYLVNYLTHKSLDTQAYPSLELERDGTGSLTAIAYINNIKVIIGRWNDDKTEIIPVWKMADELTNLTTKEIHLLWKGPGKTSTTRSLKRFNILETIDKDIWELICIIKLSTSGKLVSNTTYIDLEAGGFLIRTNNLNLIDIAERLGFSISSSKDDTQFELVFKKQEDINASEDNTGRLELSPLYEPFLLPLNHEAIIAIQEAIIHLTDEILNYSEAHIRAHSRNMNAVMNGKKKFLNSHSSREMGTELIQSYNASYRRVALYFLKKIRDLKINKEMLQFIITNIENIIEVIKKQKTITEEGLQLLARGQRENVVEFLQDTKLLYVDTFDEGIAIFRYYLRQVVYLCRLYDYNPFINDLTNVIDLNGQDEHLLSALKKISEQAYHNKQITQTSSQSNQKTPLKKRKKKKKSKNNHNTLNINKDEENIIENTQLVREEIPETRTEQNIELNDNLIHDEAQESTDSNIETHSETLGAADHFIEIKLTEDEEGSTYFDQEYTQEVLERFEQDRIKKQQIKFRARNQHLTQNNSQQAQLQENIAVLLPTERRQFQSYIENHGSSKVLDMYRQFQNAQNNALSHGDLDQLADEISKLLEQFLKEQTNGNAQGIYSTPAIKHFIEHFKKEHRKRFHNFHPKKGSKLPREWIIHRHAPWIELGIMPASSKKGHLEANANYEHAWSHRILITKR